jgi:hypothetical protein
MHVDAFSIGRLFINGSKNHYFYWSLAKIEILLRGVSRNALPDRNYTGKGHNLTF